MDMSDIGKYGKKHFFICATCQTVLERNYMPMGIIHCSACNQQCNAKENVMPDVFSLSKKALKDVADVICDRWAPKTAFIYDDFAVFRFHDKNQHDKMCNYIDAHEAMFDGLDFVSDDDAHVMMRKTIEIVAG
jgi:hypothetical protein